MIRIGATRVQFEGCERSPERAAELSREALALVARRAPEVAGGRIGTLRIEVRVERDMADGAIARRIADALGRKL